MIYQPATKKELQDLILEEMKKYGNECDLNHIDVSLVTDMSKLFYSGIGAKYHKLYLFNGNISQWNTSQVTNMDFMFWHTNFNSDISNWDVSNVTSMHMMFAKSQFNQDISQWDVSSVKSMNSMFFGSKFNSDISKWNVKSLINMEYLLKLSEFEQDISLWNPMEIEKAFEAFKSAKCPIPDWYDKNDSQMLIKLKKRELLEKLTLSLEKKAQVDKRKI